MSTRPVPPITVDDNGDLEVYADIASACHDLEIYGIHELAAFDSLGRPLQIETHGYDVIGMQVVDGVEPVPNDLARRLKTYIERLGPDRVQMPDFEDAELDVLLDGLLQFFLAGPTFETGTSRWLSRIWKLLSGR